MLFKTFILKGNQRVFLFLKKHRLARTMFSLGGKQDSPSCQGEDSSAAGSQGPENLPHLTETNELASQLIHCTYLL